MTDQTPNTRRFDRYNPSALDFQIDAISPGEATKFDFDRMTSATPDPLGTRGKFMVEQVGETGAGILSSWTGYLGGRLSNEIDESLKLSERAPDYDTPLNMGDYVPSDDFVEDQQNKENNGLSHVMELLENNIPYDHWSYILSAPSLGEYNNRLEEVVLASPEFREAGNALGKTIGFVADTAAIFAVSEAVAPIMFAGTGMTGAARGVAQARAAAGWDEMLQVTAEASQAARGLSRLNLAARGAGVAAVEEVVRHIATNVIDPTYNPGLKQIATEYIYAGGFGGALGGTFGRYWMQAEFQREADKHFRKVMLSDYWQIEHVTDPSGIGPALSSVAPLKPLAYEVQLGQALTPQQSIRRFETGTETAVGITTEPWSPRTVPEISRAAGVTPGASVYTNGTVKSRRGQLPAKAVASWRIANIWTKQMDEADELAISSRELIANDIFFGTVPESAIQRGDDGVYRIRVDDMEVEYAHRYDETDGDFVEIGRTIPERELALTPESVAGLEGTMKFPTGRQLLAEQKIPDRFVEVPIQSQDTLAAYREFKKDEAAGRISETTTATGVRITEETRVVPRTVEWINEVTGERMVRSGTVEAPVGGLERVTGIAEDPDTLSIKLRADGSMERVIRRGPNTVLRRVSDRGRLYPGSEVVLSERLEVNGRVVATRRRTPRSARRFALTSGSYLDRMTVSEGSVSTKEGLDKLADGIHVQYMEARKLAMNQADTSQQAKQAREWIDSNPIAKLLWEGENRGQIQPRDLKDTIVKTLEEEYTVARKGGRTSLKGGAAAEQTFFLTQDQIKALGIPEGVRTALVLSADGKTLNAVLRGGKVNGRVLGSIQIDDNMLKPAKDLVPVQLEKLSESKPMISRGPSGVKEFIGKQDMTPVGPKVTPVGIIEVAKADRTGTGPNILETTVDAPTGARRVSEVKPNIPEGSKIADSYRIGKPITEVIEDELVSDFTPERLQQIGRLLTEAMWRGARAKMSPKQFREFVINTLEGVLKPEERFVINRIVKDEKAWESFMRGYGYDGLRKKFPFEYAVKMSGLSADFMPLVEQGRLLDDLYELFISGLDDTMIKLGIDQTGQRSLLVQLMNELQKAMGPEGARNFTREQFNTFVEEVRTVMRNPPRLANGNVDKRGRIGQLAGVFNKYVPEGKQVKIPNYIRNRIKMWEEITAETRQIDELDPLAENLGDLEAAAVPKDAKEAEDAVRRGYQRIDMKIPILNKWFERLPFGLQRFFNQAANVLTDENALARQFGFFAYNARRTMATKDGKITAQPWTLLEWGNYTLSGYMARVLLGLRNGHVRYAMETAEGSGITLADSVAAHLGKSEKSRDLRREFYGKVIKQLRTRKFDDPVKVVNDQAKMLAALFDDVQALAQKFGVKGMENPEKNYFARIWDWDKVRRIAGTDGGREALIKFFTKSLGTVEKEGKFYRQFRDPDGTIQVFDDIDKAAVVLTDKLINIANKSDNAPLTAIDEEVAKAIGDMVGPLGETPKGVRSNRLKGRIMLDEMAEVDTGISTIGDAGKLNIDHLVDTDLPLVMKKYMTSIMGAINEKRMMDALNRQLRANRIYKPRMSGEEEPQFVEVDGLEQYMDLANKLGPTLRADTEKSMRLLMSALKYEPLQRANRELFWANASEKFTSILIPLTYMSRGGNFGISALQELSRIGSNTGLEQMITQMPILKEMVENYAKMDEGTDNFMQLVATTFHPATDRLRRHLYQDLPSEEIFKERGMYGATRRGLERGSAFFADITGLAPITSFTQNLAACATIQHLYEVGSGMTKGLDEARVASLGLTMEQYNRVAKWVAKNGKTAEVGTSRRVVDLAMTGGPEFDKLKGFIDRVVRTSIQDVPTRGDFSDLAFSFLGKMLTQFRTFSLKSVDNFLYQNLSRSMRGDSQSKMRVGKEIAASILFGGTLAYARAYMNWKSAVAAGDEERAKTIEERQLGIAGFLRGGTQASSEFMLPGMLVDGFSTTFLTDDPIMNPYQFSGMGLYGMPVMGFIKSAGYVAKDVYGATVAPAFGIESKTRAITQSTIHQGRLLMFGQNAPGIAPFLDQFEQTIADMYNLPERQPR